MINVELPNSAIDILYPNEHAIFAPCFDPPTYSANQMYELIKSNGAMRSEINSAIAKISEIESWDLNWDGYGALKISNITSRNAQFVITQFCNSVSIPDITPNPNGTISFEWETHEGFAHFEIGRTKYSFYIKPTVGNTLRFDGQVENLDISITTFINAILYPSITSTNTITKIIVLTYDLRPS